MELKAMGLSEITQGVSLFPRSRITPRFRYMEEEQPTDDWEAMASEWWGKPEVCGLMKAKYRNYFKKKRIVNYAKCCWEVESEEGWELTIGFSKVDVMIRLNESNFSGVLGIKVYLEGVQRRLWEKAVLMASLGSSLEKFYYKEELENVAESGGGWKVKGGFLQDQRKYSMFEWWLWCNKKRKLIR